jgi:hypothetical protein
MFKKAPKFLWIIMLALATVTFSCNKHDDDDDDGGNGGGGGIWNPTIIDGRLPGLFSVSQDQQVQFSQGNLQYRASTNTWRFAEHQWDYVGSQKSSFVGEVDGVSIIWENIGGTVSGSDNSEISPTYNGWIDLFGWGTSGYNGKNPYMTSTSNIDYGNGENNIAGTNYDWGVYNAISNGGNRKNYWRTLTHEEWKYLFEMRTTPSGIRFAKAKVNDVGGIILLPDDWNASTYSLNNTNTDTSEAYFDDNTISASQWTTLENAGAVFLPAAGWRSESLVLPVYGFKGVSDFSIPCCGYYWLASGNPYAARGVLFLEGGLHKCKGIADFDRSAGLSVRLVHSTQNNNDNHIEVTTNNVTDITQTTAVCGGNVTITGNGTVTARGVCWSTNSNPTVNDNHTSNGTGTGNFTSNITGLTPNTTYYVRAYATNNAGTVYGEQKMFTTFTGGGNGNAPEGAIDGLFSISATEQVYFSQGNLQYQASTKKWRFAENQWTIVGEDNKNVSSTYNGWIDLFGWGTSGHYHGAVCYQPWSTSTNVQDYYAYGSVTYNLYDQTGQADWGSNPIINGGNTANLWRTLTYEEWGYLLYIRNTNSNIRFATARVNRVNGLILLPDNWNAYYYNLDKTNNSHLYFSNNVIDLSTWENIFQAHGAVFLPAAGIRHGANYTPPNQYMGYGGYWSASTNNSSFAHSLSFYRTNFSNDSSGHCLGLSVRLVRPAN